MMSAIPQPVDEPASILIVDDDRDIRTLLTDSLGARGYRVSAAANTR